MKSLTDSLAESAGTLILILLVLSGALFLGVVSLWRSLRKTSTRMRSLLEGARGENVERMLYDQLRERVETEDQLRDVRKRLQSLESRILGSKRFMGLVRFDAFEEVGGAQSFALALYDESGEGIVLSSLVGRADCRVYCKALVNGRADRNLSAEEQEAVTIAAAARSQAATIP